MEYSARLAREGASSPAVQEALLAHLATDLAGDVRGKRGSREKATTVLMRTWITPPQDLEALRNHCLELIKGTLDSSIRVAIHWAMIGAVYPFWLAVAASAGRLLRLQKTVTASQIRRRLSETYGDRELVARATRTVLRSYVDWGVLDGVDTRGTYSAKLLIEVEDPGLVALLAEAILCSSPNDTIRVQDFLLHPGLFPFRLGNLNSRTLASASRRLEVHDTGAGKILALTKTGNKQADRPGIAKKP